MKAEHSKEMEDMRKNIDVLMGLSKKLGLIEGLTGLKDKDFDFDLKPE